MEDSVNNLGGVFREVAAAHRESLIAANVLARVRSRPPARRSSARRVLARLPRMRFVMPALAAAGFAVVAWGTRPAPITFAVASAIPRGGEGEVSQGADTGAVTGAGIGDPLDAPAGSRLPVVFSDGSRIALEGGARARVTSLDARGATVQLEHGRAEVDVRHRRNTRWQLRAGSFEVAVTGTRFSIDWNEKTEALTVIMTDGTVEVRGRQLAGATPIVVTTGQRFHATARESRWTLAASSAPEVAPLTRPVGVGVTATTGAEEDDSAGSSTATRSPPGEGPPAGAATASPGGRATAAPGQRSWQLLARAGRYEEALETAERAGFEKACRKLGAEDLVQLGDVARLARNVDRAEEAYQLARKRFPGNDRPAFALGLVAFEQRRDFRSAGRWFDTYVRRYPKGPLAREALGREMESWHRAGDTGRAKQTGRTYLSQAPTGPYAPLARQILAP